MLSPMIERKVLHALHEAVCHSSTYVDTNGDTEIPADVLREIGLPTDLDFWRRGSMGYDIVRDTGRGAPRFECRHNELITLVLPAK